MSFICQKKYIANKIWKKEKPHSQNPPSLFSITISSFVEKCERENKIWSNPIKTNFSEHNILGQVINSDIIG